MFQRVYRTSRVAVACALRRLWLTDTTCAAGLILWRADASIGGVYRAFMVEADRLMPLYTNEKFSYWQWQHGRRVVDTLRSAMERGLVGVLVLLHQSTHRRDEHPKMSCYCSEALMKGLAVGYALVMRGKNTPSRGQVFYYHI